MSVVHGKVVKPKKGKQMKRQRPSIMVNQIDTAKLTELLISKRGKNDIEAESMVVVNTPKGLATICTEGVGWWEGEKGYLVGGYVGYANITYYLNKDELLSVLSGDQIDLSQFVNSFGDRLEVNYDLWYHQVKDTPQELRVGV